MIWVVTDTLTEAKELADSQGLTNFHWGWLDHESQLKTFHNVPRYSVVVMKAHCYTIKGRWIDILGAVGAAVITVRCPRCMPEGWEEREC